MQYLTIPHIVYFSFFYLLDLKYLDIFCLYNLIIKYKKQISQFLYFLISYYFIKEDFGYKDPCGGGYKDAGGEATIVLGTLPC